MDTNKEGKTMNGKVSSEENSYNHNSEGVNKQKRKRRSKNEKDGRSFKCDECGKSYLSQPALTNHKKTKHNFGQNEIKKGRGRPRKNPPTIMPSNDTAEKKFKQYFDIDLRLPSDEPVGIEYIKECLRDIVEKYSDIFSCASIEHHSFLEILTNIFTKTDDGLKERDSNNNNIEKHKKDIKCDTIFSYYLKEIASKTNKEYFNFVFKFVTLFRECINKLHKSNKEDNPELGLNNDTQQADFTQLTNAESVPDTCNEFITEFMEPNDYFGLDTGELIEIIQHLCFWLYINQYTTSRLTLL